MSNFNKKHKIEMTHFWSIVSITCMIMLIGVACESDNDSSSSTTSVNAGETSNAGTDIAEPMNGGTDGSSNGPLVHFEFTNDLVSTPFTMIPFPHDAYRNMDGSLNLTGFPNVRGILAKLVENIEEETKGFGTTSGFYLSFADEIDIDLLPSQGSDSLRDQATLALVDIDPQSKEYGRRWPLYWNYQSEADAYRPAHTLNVRLLEGIALRPTTTYALILTQSIASPSDPFVAMLSDTSPSEPHAARMWNLYAPLRAWLNEQGSIQPSLAVASIFTTQDPVSELFSIRNFIYQQPTPVIENIESRGIQDRRVDYELFRANYTASRFQEGDIPFQNEGGAIRFESNGNPIIQGEETLRLSFAIPVTPMPANGWPLVLYAHGTGGNFESYHRQEVASVLARRGLAVASIDQIHHGPRNAGACSGNDSACVSRLVFNFLQPAAGRDNIRQSAIDYITLSRVMSELNVSAGQTQADQAIKINGDQIMFMGHSQGGLNGPLFMAVEPQVLGGVLSGAGANIAISLEQKTKPININQLIGLALGISDETLDRWHPALALLQTFIEPGDSANYGRFWFTEVPEGFRAKSILMTAGLLDDYTPPDTIFSLAVSGRVPIVSPVTQSIDALDFLGVPPAGRSPVANVASGEATAGLLQYEDQGHFLVFDLPEVQNRYGQFLEQLANRPPPQIP